ncbi:4'-phosphopantetheinyl transferase family protein [Ramlibacter sp. PS4R-6]|uniref:4'-phosphopantetheinyl transferase family protein n=1 Tax=Ramlibacter sp. PS4R-6 TaxID=3133438 RepID=UPI0030B1201B
MSAPVRIAPLEGVEVHVLDGAPPPEAHALLSPEESERAARLRGPGQAQAYVCAHAALRRLLAQRTRRDARELRFTNGPKGKPALDDAPGVHFSISYRAGCAAVAIATRPVGVDVERVDAAIDATGIAQRFFTRDEQAWLAAAREPQAFFALWTRKEALVKAAGVGIDGMGRAAAQGETARIGDETGRERHYRILQLDAMPGYALALAVEEQGNEP